MSRAKGDLQTSFKSVVAAVLCGGEGSRLRPLTYYFQKSMIPVGSSQKPLLEYIIRLMRDHGIRDIVFLVNYKYEQILNYFGDGSRFDVNIGYVADRGDRRGTGWAILNAYEKGVFKGCENVLVYYGDILSNIDLTEMLKTHEGSDASATLALSKGYRLPVGVARVEGFRILGFEEKPLINVPVCIGIAVFKMGALQTLHEMLMDELELDIMGHMMPKLIELREPVNAYFTDCFWYDVGSTEKYEKLDHTIVDRLFERAFKPVEYV
ncbi:nucleotidyltransferase family protein [Candidatus Bathyarchaeota archaeon]|nr:nucleotidyltransferase family protein [Candidatus Bathyarchaeota archaeon]